MSGTRLELSPSWSLAAAIVALHSLAAVSVLLVLPGLPGFSLAIAFLALGLAAAWARGLHRSGASVTAIELSPREVFIELRDGRRLGAEVGPNRHVSRYMVTLPLKAPLRRTLLVTRDMLEAQEFRRLRIWALWGKLPRVVFTQLPA